MDNKKVLTLTTIEEVKAISDPFKYRILKCFGNKAEPATVKQIADELNEVPAKVYYHVKKMESAGILRLVYTKEINGIVAKYYEPTAEDFEIKCSKELEESSKKILLAESQNIVSEVYNTSKEEFLKQINAYSKVKTDKKEKGSARISKLYITEDEMIEFIGYINAFIDKHKDDVKDEKHKKFHFFLSTFEITEE